ncbi:MAG: Phosphate regulon transcriptional regulatory protein PhoB [Candidatus Woesebacteria bacterium GW2011_GWA2_40_7]|uniref:Phosphate regulon transcriptional regulatory protein PhoB n=3 Tax=Candidatus Woeseibacteriota TaxID=1752722 RepID=A0A0G0UXF5_9BACT|nr:MAG: Phosphate regulon transcriptional regulatory protein PhoB [Candidatus Woesebacteria bacterium GW2011_GWB1_39_10]KKR73307.1 MAG: Phosphate regulon transcriptional regulatory protein PhoB [Candidatus Woesebacteria bacterium GW2011_GWA2_40_7]KKR92161.1 MAG: Phosphate regulon transcriptional regulatory protein PhoB [Candidatus Woesebacteria bacterium GW2011_GWA1_41_13b]
MEEDKKKTVLVIEDEIVLRDLIVEKLEETSVETIVASTAQEGELKIKEQHPSLILLDIMLPGGMNGFDLLEQLKRDPILKSIPVIVLTNLSTEHKTATEIGAIDYIVKSNISLDEVALKVKNHLQ